MKWCPLIGAVLFVLPLSVRADDDEAPAPSVLGAKWTEAVDDAIARCERAEAKRVLVLVRADADVETVPPQLLETVRAELAERMKGPEVVAECPEKAAPLPDRPERPLSARDVRSLGTAFEFDAVLDVTYRVSRGTPAMRLMLFKGTRRLSSTQVTFGEDPPRVAGINRTPGVRPGVFPGQRMTPRRSSVPSTAGGVGRRTAVNGDPANRKPGDGDEPKDPKDDDPSDDEPEPPKGGTATGLNAGVLGFAQQNFGRTVGNGECWTLANEALKAAGARPAVGYTFGAGINRRDVTPGDILQFTSVRIEKGNQFWNLGTPQHTAIVEAVEGTVVTVLHQNFGTRTVTRLTFDFEDVVRGEIGAFRPRR